VIKKVTLPLTDETAKELNCGDKLLLSGVIYVARDAAHERIVAAINKGAKPPFGIKDSVIYYAGPSPTRTGDIIGVIGPTTSGRMDSYTPFLLERGLRAMIGKGKRSAEVIAAIKKHKALYFGATGGAAVLLQNSVVSAKTLAYPELGPEAVLELEIKDMPLVVVIDTDGNDLYTIGQEKARKLKQADTAQ